MPNSVIEAERLVQDWKRYYETVEKPAKCIRCAANRIGWNGSRARSASVLVADKVEYIAEVRCRRVKCSECGKSWTLRPPGLCAHKHYQLCVIAKATSALLFEPQTTLSAIAHRVGCARRTIGRWLRWVAQISDPALVMQKVLETVEAPIVMPLRVAAARLGKGRSTGCRVLEQAAEVLAALEALGSAWRLEPPGLRAVLERVVGNRVGVATYRRPRIPELARSQPG